MNTPPVATLPLFGHRSMLAAALPFALALAGCSGSGSSSLTASAAKVDMVKACFPSTYSRLNILVDVIETWRLDTTTMAADPAGLVWTERNDGVLQVSYNPGSSLPMLDMQITFFDPSGVAQDIDLTGATSLSAAIDLAAMALATTAAPRPFLVADWSLRDPGNVIFGAGGLTAIIGGSVGQSRLERVYTSTGSTTANGGPPTGSTATIATDGGSNQCVTVIDAPDLLFDTGPGQQYPQGVITFDITGPQQSAAVSATFDGSSQVVLSIDGVPATLTFDLFARTIG